MGSALSEGGIAPPLAVFKIVVAGGLIRYLKAQQPAGV